MEISLDVKRKTLNKSLNVPLITVTGASTTMEREVSQDINYQVLPESGHTDDSTDTPLTSLARFAASSGSPNSDIPVEHAPLPKHHSKPKHLLPEATRKEDGLGPVVALEGYRSKLLVVTLGINDVVERTGLTVSVWGSPDRVEWGPQALITFRQRQYCGVYSVLLNLAMHPEVCYLRTQWSMSVWGKVAHTPRFGFEVFLEESGSRLSGSAVA
jgi:hypothetical protein